MAAMIREYFREYYHRLVTHGLHVLPASFNVVEAFFRFSERYCAFDLRPEREHLFRLADYFDWYAAGAFPGKPSVLVDIMEDGLVYEYNAVEPACDISFATTDSDIRPVGVAMVRHAHELSLMLVAGENPPHPADEEVSQQQIGERAIGHEGIEPHPDYTTTSRYLEGLDGYSRLIILGRFDLIRARYDVRYVNQDIGASFRVLTDDRICWDALPTVTPELINLIAEKLLRYSGVFSAASSMMYLPAFFIDRMSKVTATEFATELRGRQNAREVREANGLLPPMERPLFRTVHCLASYEHSSQLGSHRLLDPPDLQFESTGYWRPLRPNEAGTDKDDNPIIGKTWVERTDSWTAQALSSFVVSPTGATADGPDPGIVYIARSGSHAGDYYKIGITRRSAEVRAKELSGATGVPSHFEILASWSVGDCCAVEREVHDRLSPHRVNKRREFFRVPLPDAIRVINDVVEDQ